jgi:radical SAM-linked protein
VSYYINPVTDLGEALLGVEKPARYTGGEFGRLAKRVEEAGEAPLQTIIAFPDLYEIGMSNYALKIIYNRMNALTGVICDRAFAPAPDFEELLTKKQIPLYGLDTGIALSSVDILMFTLGYELGITTLLAMLKNASIPLHSEERDEIHPIVIMGGVCASNPLPYAAFIDAFWIGEAEAGFFNLIEQARDAKRKGEGRGALLELLRRHPSVWYKDKPNAVRAIHTGFSQEAAAAIYPVPSMRVVQQHGYVEIMRGCPNGCRFCHAGMWYRPMRQKDARIAALEVEEYVKKGGFREISLSSLSSADYDGIDALACRLNTLYKGLFVSFQLPSLHVSTFSLPLLKEISKVRKSGLTFAVETPSLRGQLSINKTAGLDTIAETLIESKKYGWKGAKLYFMTGLPFSESAESDEADEIITFVKELSRRVRMVFTINVGIFIPKPHTPFQWQAQAENKRGALKKITAALKPLGHKVNTANAFISRIEGLLSRGDERVGRLIEDAFLSGASLDAWSDRFRFDIWERIAAENEPLFQEILGAKADLPWSCIDSGIREAFLKQELSNSKDAEQLCPCQQNCTHSCGVCDKDKKIQKNIHTENNSLKLGENFIAGSVQARLQPGTYRILFSYSKKGPALFLSHLSIIEVFSMALLRAGIEAEYSEGFNPIPKLTFASPISIGISANNEIASVDVRGALADTVFISKMNEALPEGIRINAASCVYIPFGEKKISVPSVLWGFAYTATSSGALPDFVATQDEKAYRQKKIGRGEGVFSLCRHAVLAKNADSGFMDYFDFYKQHYTPV